MMIGDRAYGSLVGCAVGDAMGMPASFLTPNQIRWHYDYIDSYIDPLPEIQQYHGNLDAGEITDDTMEMMILADTLIEAGKFDAKVFAEGMNKWNVENDLLNSTIIGPSTRAYLEAIQRGEVVSPVAANAMTNGSAMRIAPIGVKYHYSIEACIEAAYQSSVVSHAAAPAVAGACAVAAAIAACHNEELSLNDIMNIAYDAARYGERNSEDICAPSVSRRIRMAKKIVDENKGKNIDYIMDQMVGIFGASMKAYESVPIAIGAFYAAGGDAAIGIPAAVNAGDDADTNAAICGSICGAYSGISGIPKEWVEPVLKSAGRDLKAMSRQLLKRV